MHADKQTQINALPIVSDCRAVLLQSLISTVAKDELKLCVKLAFVVNLAIAKRMAQLK